MISKTKWAAALAALAFAAPAAAHDFFLMPVGFTQPATGPVKVQATVGSNFPVAEIVVTADRVERLYAAGPGKPRLRVVAAGAKALDLEAVGARRGLLVAAVATRPRDVDYAEDRIPLILGEYRVLPEAAAAVEALPRPRSWKVVSRRFAKSLLCVADCRDRRAAATAFGAPLEFVASRAMADHVTLLGNGRPLALYPVDLVGADGKRRHLATDRAGALHLPADARGAMMLFAARLEPPRGAERFTLDLTSLTLHRP